MMPVTTNSASLAADHAKTFDAAYDAYYDGTALPVVEDILARAFQGEALQAALLAITEGTYHA